jgi:hypothetical protein
MRPVGDVLPALLDGLQIARPLAGWRAVAEWPQVVGERLARRTRAVRWSEGKLWVEVQGSVWLHELGFLKRDLIQRLNRHLGADLVQDLVLVRDRGGNRR